MLVNPTAAFKRLSQAININISPIWIIIEGGHCQNEVLTVATVRRVLEVRRNDQRCHKPG